MKLTLSRSEFKDMKRIGRGRYLAKNYSDEKGGRKDLKHDEKQTGLQIHIDGACSEKVLANYWGVDIDESFSKRGDGGKRDLRVSGYDISVKTTRCKTGKLLFDILKNGKNKFKSDFAVLVIRIDSYEYKVAGFISKEDFEETYFVHDMGYGDRHMCRQRDLSPLSEFEHFLEHPGSRRPLNKLPKRKQT